MLAPQISERINYSNAKALRRIREHMRVTRKELAQRLGLTNKRIEKYENGREQIDEARISQVLEALNLTREHFQRIKKGKPLMAGRPKKNVTSNQERRSYRRVITKEVRVLKILRRQKGISQDHASTLCGYSRPTIGHIENGRIEIPVERIHHIVQSFGHSISEFDKMMKEESMRDEVIEACIHKLLGLSEEKLKLCSSLIQSM